jgi:hypothetical protein
MKIIKNLTNAATAHTHTHTHRFSFLIALLCIFTISFTSCGDGDDPVTPDPVKTLDKAKILDKKWYTKGDPGTAHYFYSSGKYGFDGSWKWLGDEKSDSMEVYQYAGSIRFVLYFEYCTDTELSTKWGKSDPAYTLYKDKEW